jgi:glucose/arabinose dehydrogenase
VSDAFPDDALHGWKFIAFGPDGKLYVPVGAPCNVCDPDDERFATIQRMNPGRDRPRDLRPGHPEHGGVRLGPETG